jgi:hypothetical protein
MRGNFNGFTALNAQAANEASLFADQVDTLVDEPIYKYLLNQLRAARRCLRGSRSFLDLVFWIWSFGSSLLALVL